MTNVNGRPRVYENPTNISIVIDRSNLDFLDRLRGTTPRGRYIALSLQRTQDTVPKILELEALLGSYADIIEKNNVLIKSHELTIAGLNAEIKRLSEEAVRSSSPDSLSRPATEDDQIDNMRKDFIERNIGLLQSFIANNIPKSKLVAIQRQLVFPTLPKLKLFLTEEYARRMKEGSASLAGIKAVAPPPLSLEQQAYKDELTARLRQAQATLSQMKAKVAEAFNHGMQSDYNQLAVGSAEAEKQVMAIIEEFGAARKIGFTRPVKPSAQESESTHEKVPSAGSPSNPAVVPEPKSDEANTGGLTADQLMFKIQQEEEAVRGDTPGKAAGELKEITASLTNDSPVTESSGTQETASKRGCV